MDKASCAKDASNFCFWLMAIFVLFAIPAGLLAPIIEGFVSLNCTRFSVLVDTKRPVTLGMILLGMAAAFIGYMCVVGITKCTKFRDVVIVILIVSYVVATVVVTVLAFTWNIKDNNSSKMGYAVDNYIGTFKEEMDYVQETYKCCGIMNATDWTLSKAWNDTKDVPDSCCSTGNKCSLNSQHIYQKGCFDELIATIQAVFRTVGSIGILILGETVLISTTGSLALLFDRFASNNEEGTLLIQKNGRRKNNTYIRRFICAQVHIRPAR